MPFGFPLGPQPIKYQVLGHKSNVNYFNVHCSKFLNNDAKIKHSMVTIYRNNSQSKGQRKVRLGG